MFSDHFVITLPLRGKTKRFFFLVAFMFELRGLRLSRQAIYPMNHSASSRVALRVGRSV
jgi:hypothetical protein